MKLKTFEVIYRAYGITPERHVIVKAKSMRTLNKRLSKHEQEDCLIHELKPGVKLKPVESHQNLCVSRSCDYQDCIPRQQEGVESNDYKKSLYG